jgi:hypothetical protein
MHVADVDTVRRLDINDLTLFVANDGILGFDRSLRRAGLLSRAEHPAVCCTPRDSGSARASSANCA